MNCPKCQFPVAPDDLFCPECGTRIIQDQSVCGQSASDQSFPYKPVSNQAFPYESNPGQPIPNQSIPYQPVMNQPVSGQPHPKKNTSKFIIIIVAVILVLAIVAGVGLFFIIGQKNKNTDRQSDGTTTVTEAAGENNTDDDEAYPVFNQSTASSTQDTTSADTSGVSGAELTQPNIRYSKETYYVSPLNGAAIKSGPSSTDKTLFVMDYDSVVEIRGGYDSAKDWVYVYCPDKSAYGWISGNQISETKPSAAVPYTPQSENDYTNVNHQVTYYATPSGSYVTTPAGKRLMLRSAPDTTEDNIIAKMPSGAFVTVYGYSTNHPDWLYVKYYEDGFEYTGFASSEYIG